MSAAPAPTDTARELAASGKHPLGSKALRAIAKPQVPTSEVCRQGIFRRTGDTDSRLLMSKNLELLLGLECESRAEAWNRLCRNVCRHTVVLELVRNLSRHGVSKATGGYRRPLFCRSTGAYQHCSLLSFFLVWRLSLWQLSRCTNLLLPRRSIRQGPRPSRWNGAPGRARTIPSRPSVPII
jgi:hypothetical protein